MPFRNSALYHSSNYYKSPWRRTTETEVWWLPSLPTYTTDPHAACCGEAKDVFLHFFYRAKVTWKVAEGTLNALIQIIDKDVKQDWPHSWALGNSGSQLDVTLFATSFRALPSRQVLTLQKIHLSKPWTRRMGAGRVSLAKGTCCAFLRQKCVIWQSCSPCEGLSGPAAQGTAFWDLHDVLAVSLVMGFMSCSSSST